MTEPRLVYVEPNENDNVGLAFFSSEEKPWGDDWNDAPYEHNAGRPYKWDARVVFLDADLQAPNYGVLNSSYSVEQINAGMVAWLRSPSWAKDMVVIPAGVGVNEFIARVQRAGGIAMVVKETE